MDATRRITTSDLSQTEVIQRAPEAKRFAKVSVTRGTNQAGIQRRGRRNGMARRRRRTGSGTPLNNGEGVGSWGNMQRGAPRPDRSAPRRDWLKTALRARADAGVRHRRAACRRLRARARAGARSRADRRPHRPRRSRSRSASRKACAPESSFSEVIVSDPDVADAIPLTDRSLSVLGKKIGTARVSVYGEGKKLVGVFDIEVSYDTSRLGSELAQRFPHARFRVSSVNGRIMLARHRARRRDGRPGDDHRQAVRRRRHQFREGERAAAGDAGSALRRSLALGRPRSRRQLAGVVQQNLSGTAATVSARRSAPPGSSPARRRSAPWSARMLGNGVQADVLVQALEERGIVRRLAEPNLDGDLGRDRELPGGRRIPHPGRVEPRQRHGRVQEIRRRPRLHADRARRRRDQPEDRAGGEPDRSDHDDHDRRRSPSRR